VGEAPPIFAQAANGSISRYVAYDPYGPKAEGIVVAKDSKINRLADLKGKRIAVQKGSNTHYLVVKALQAAKLKPSQVEIVFLKPSDGRAAFERKDVSAWAVWAPYLAYAEANAEARLLADARGLAPNRGYYLASTNIIGERPDTLKLVLKAIHKEGQSVSANPEGTASFLAPILGLQANVLATAEKRRRHGALPITDPKIIEQQQDIADTFSELQLIPKKINVKDAIWKWN
jgi:sulfonate transport system substrate-binding protein